CLAEGFNPARDWEPYLIAVPKLDELTNNSSSRRNAPNQQAGMLVLYTCPHERGALWAMGCWFCPISGK
ncbi:MAG: hypothetical protein ACPGWR_29290, partial [Ardenticatenaceae bacterium]